MSTSDPRSGSSGRSKKRETVFVSTTQRDRARQRGRDAAASAGGRKPAQKPRSEARLLAEARKSQRDARLGAQRRGAQLRVAAAVVAVMLVFGGAYAVYASSLFSIRTVEVVGNVHMTADAVRALAKVSADATLIRFPADVVAARVAANPWVADVTVSRVFPSGMRIRITERVPVGIVTSSPATAATSGPAAMWLVDGTGMVIAKPTTETSATIPLITGVPGLDLKAGRRTTSEPLLNAIKVLAGITPRLETTVRSVSAPSVDGATLLLANRVEVVMGEAVDLVKKSSLAEQILSDQKGKVVSIDVRIVDRPTWRGLK